MNTIGTVRVAASAARAATRYAAAMIPTFLLINSAASDGKRSYSPSADLFSILTLLP